MSKRGRPNGSEQREVPPKIFEALQLWVGGNTWTDSADAVGCDIRTLRKYREYPECKQFIDEYRRESLNTAHTKLVDASPRVADELLKVALDPKTKAYAKVSACESVFRIIQTGVQDAEMRQKLEAIKDQLASLERGGPTVIDV